MNRATEVLIKWTKGIEEVNKFGYFCLKAGEMVTVIKKGVDLKLLNKQMEIALKTKGVNTHKYYSQIKLQEDPLKIQKKLRNEWQ